MLHRSGKRLEAGSGQECQGRHGGVGGVAHPGDHGVFTDVKTKAWYIYFHIYPLTTQTQEQDVDNANILTNTQFMLSAP